MTRSWTRDVAEAPGTIILPDGIRIRLDQPNVGALPHVFIDIVGAGHDRRLLIEPRSNVRIGDHLLCITALDDRSVAYRTSHVHEDVAPLRQRLRRSFSRDAVATA